MGDADRRSDPLARVRERPIITAVMVACTIAGAWLGHQVLADDFSPLRAVLGGAVAGAGCGLLVTFTKLAD